MVRQAESHPLQYPEVQNIIILDGSPDILNAYVKNLQRPGVQREVDLFFTFLMILSVEINSLEVSIYNPLRTKKLHYNFKIEETYNPHFISECDVRKQASCVKETQ
ncbi:hypothetical protein TNCV_4089501 [Trichonephila clavipes]|nr:hypothetical protein TNCV_4089501 [Trichonephila clavipes]